MIPDRSGATAVGKLAVAFAATPVVAVVVPSSADNEVLVGSVVSNEELTKLLETKVAVKPVVVFVDGLVIKIFEVDVGVELVDVVLVLVEVVRVVMVVVLVEVVLVEVELLLVEVVRVEVEVVFLDVVLFVVEVLLVVLDVVVLVVVEVLLVDVVIVDVVVVELVVVVVRDVLVVVDVLEVVLVKVVLVLVVVEGETSMSIRVGSVLESPPAGTKKRAAVPLTVNRNDMTSPLSALPPPGAAV
jgi:hypothetical protein